MEKLFLKILVDQLTENDPKLNKFSCTLKEFVREIVNEALDCSGSQPQPESDLVSRKEAMDLLNVKTKATMIAWERREFLKPYRISNRVFYQRKEILEAALEFKRN